MLKHKSREAEKVDFVPSTDIVGVLIQLNHGPIWIKLEKGGDVLLHGTDTYAWKLEGNLYIGKAGKDKKIPADTPILGYYTRQ